jgi:spore coat-associated protein N
MKFIGLQTMTGKLLATAAVLGSTAAVASYGTFGSFTASTTTASSSVTSGTVALALGTDATAANRLSVAATGIVPTDSIQRAVDLTNSGSQNLASLTLTTAATTSSLLNTNTTMGLQLKVDHCATAWTESGVAPAYTYTCAGGSTVSLASTPVVQSAISLSNMVATTAGATDHLRITLTLPTGADNTLQGQSSVIGFTFNGTQRAGTDK